MTASDIAPVITTFSRQGFAAIPDFLTAEDCAHLKAAAQRVVEEKRVEMDKGIFSTREQEKNSNDWFLESGNKVRLFMEEETEPGVERRVNKIGHALHRQTPEFVSLSADHRLGELAAAIGLKNPLHLQSMYIFKPPRVGGEVRAHQDAAFLYTEPVTVTGFWFALDDANIENGCLWALPGGHAEPLRERFVRDGQGGTKFLTLDDRPLPESGYVPLEVKAGTLVLLHGLLPHYSEPNRSAFPRNAYALHMIDSSADYPAENWLEFQ